MKWDLCVCPLQKRVRVTQSCELWEYPGELRNDQSIQRLPPTGQKDDEGEEREGIRLGKEDWADEDVLFQVFAYRFFQMF